jgi:iron complex outermembrane receptor protein
MSGQTNTIDRPNSILAAAISTALAPTGAALAQDTPPTSADKGTIDEIIVTARKREESLQRVPFSIQAIPEAQLKQMGASAMADYARFIPSMSWSETSPGLSTIVFRGVRVSGGPLSHSSSSVYFDEFPITSMGSQPDPYLVDIARVEALAGPQGTLFGASSQSGLLRIVPNHPDTSSYEVIADMSVTTGSDSATGYEFSGVLNIPLVEDKFAIRLVGFSAEDAGFVDNIFGHTPDTYSGSNINFTDIQGIPAAESGTLDNAAIVEDDWNGVDHTGVRIAALWNMNESWSASLMYLHQESEVSGGYNDYNPAAGDLNTIQWNKSVRDDKWDALSLVLEGDIGSVHLVSATSYYDRVYTDITDRTAYHKHWSTLYCANSYPNIYGGYYPYFQDPATGTLVSYPRYCWGPTAQSDITTVQGGTDWEDKISQEFRLSHEGENLDWLLGLFYEDSNDNWDRRWGWPTSNDYQDSLSLVYWEVGGGSTWGAAGSGFGVGFAPDAIAPWFDQDYTNWTQKAVFGEVTWRIGDQWTAIVGGRAFERTSDKRYLVQNPETLAATTGAISEGSGTASDFVPKFSLTYQINDSKMMYGLVTQGFRAGGTNRSRGEIFFPLTYDADKLTNYELGTKTMWGGGTFQANITLFHMAWADYQLEVVDPSFIRCGDPGAVDPCSSVWQTVVGNAGNAHSEGIEATFVWVPTDGLELGLNAMFLSAETDNGVDIDQVVDGNGETQFEIPAGARLPLSPESKASIYATYSWPARFTDGEFFVRAQWAYTGDSLTSITTDDLVAGSGDNLGISPQRTLASYAIGDLRAGLVGTDWEVNLFINNVTDERAEIATDNAFEHLFSNSQDGISSYHRIFTNRPREYGVRFMKRWGG